MENIMNLASLLNQVETNDDIKEANFLTDGFFHELHEDIQKATLQAEKILINEGRCNWDNINELKELGYDVWPSDNGNDNSSWITGCIYTNKGIIVYG